MRVLTGDQEHSTVVVRQTAARHPAGLRVALLSYRGKAHCGGQGVYIRNLSRELTRLGHRVEVIAGQPFPVLDDGVALRRLPSLDLYREDDPFRLPGLGEFRDPIDVLEFATMCVAGFPEPLTFSLRAFGYLRGRRHDFDVVHDNQCLGYGLLGADRVGLPVVATIHHPLTVDRTVSLAAAKGWQRITLRRWYAFVRMQRRVAQRLPAVLTVSESSRADIARDLGVDPARMRVVPVGVDPDVFRPDASVARVPGRIVTMASADVPLKGLVHLLEAVAKVRTEREATLVVIGKPRTDGPTLAAVRRLGLSGAVRFVNGLGATELASTIQQAEVAVVPSLYEGFSLPAIEFMACGVPLVATTGGALPEVVGEDGATGLLVPPADEGALAAAILRLLSDEGLRSRIGARGRERVLSRFTWAAAAASTAEAYAAAIEAGRRRAHRRL